MTPVRGATVCVLGDRAHASRRAAARGARPGAIGTAGPEGKGATVQGCTPWYAVRKDVSYRSTVETAASAQREVRALVLH